MINLNFEKIQTPWGLCHAHKIHPAWVVFYEQNDYCRRHYKAYVATQTKIRNNHPCLGGVDNVSINGKTGFETFNDACMAIDKHFSGE